MKRPIFSSHLALRFYYRDGWTEELLRSCLENGDVKCFYPEDPENFRYLSLDHTKNSTFNVEKLMEHVSVLKRWNTEIIAETQSDAEYIRSMNW